MDLLLRQKARKSTCSDLLLGLLIPALLLKTHEQEMALDIVVPTSLLFIVMSRVRSMFVLSVGMYTCTILATLVESVFTFRPILILGFIFCSTYNFITLFPQTFTLGEAIILSQLSTVFIQRSSVFCLTFIIFFLIERYFISCSLDSLVFFSCAFGTSVFFLCRLSPAFALFYNLQGKRLMCYLSVKNCFLLLFWLILFMGCVAFVWISRHVADDARSITHHDNDVNLKSVSHDSIIDPAIHSTEDAKQAAANQSLGETGPFNAVHKRTPFWMRKVFHFAAGLVYATGILWSPGLLSLASVGLLVLFITLEWIRRRGPKMVVRCLDDVLDPFRDERDSGELIFTPIALLLGLSLPLWWPLCHMRDSTVELDRICEVPKLHPSVWSGVLSIAVGDSMAALVGRAWGRLRWPGTHRTFLGSTASFLSQLVVWIPIARHEGIRWSSGLIPILAGVLTEAYLEHIDNLIIPLIVMIAFPSSLSA